MPRKVSAMSPEEIAATPEYQCGVAACKSAQEVGSSKYFNKQQDLLFRIGWGDTDLVKRGAEIPKQTENLSPRFLDGRTPR